tara:strand:+ start:13914 stop:14831 length:918 start_codon:yes stop_codon:yes gene_type:complete
MAIDCSCNSTLQNLGSPDCPSVMQIARKFIFVPKYNAQGKENMLKADQLNKQTILELINANDSLSRYYPTATVENTEDTRAEPITQEFNSGKIITVREGARTNTSIVPLGSTQELGHYKSFGCSEFGAYVLDAGGNFIYYKKKGADGEDYLCPIQIDNETFYCMLMKATDAEVQMLSLTWQWKLTQKDENLRFVPADSLDFTSDDLNGLFDVTGTYSGLANNDTQFSLSLETTDFGTPVTELVQADFKVFIDGVNGTISSIQETTPGTYLITMSAPLLTGNKVNTGIQKEGFDFSSVLADEQVVS